MTNYANTKAHKLVPTHCACCGRALTDATSIEAGVGPVCRKKYNYEDAPVVDSETAEKVLAIVSDTDVFGKVKVALDKGDSRRAANVLVHFIACRQKENVSMHAAYALNMMGFKKLSKRVADRVADVTIKMDGDRLVLDTPYDADFVSDVRSVVGRRWDSDNKVNTFPLSSKKAVWNLLKKHFTGGMGYGPKGPFEIK